MLAKRREAELTLGDVLSRDVVLTGVEDATRFDIGSIFDDTFLVSRDGIGIIAAERCHGV
jgi:hypothetical protein